MKYTIIAVILLSVSLVASTIKTPSDVYSQAILLKQKVIYIRQEAKIKGAFPKIEVQTNKAPTHVLQKSLEVLSKINRYRIIKNYGEISIPEYPSREITPSDVYSYVKRLNEEVTPFIDNKKFINSLKLKKYNNKTPSDVYKLLWSVSLAIDPMLGIRGFTPTDVYAQSETIVDIARFLKQSQGDFTTIKKPDVKKGLHPNHALNASYELLEKIAKVDKRLWIKRTQVPKKSYKVITPTHVYDSLQNIIAEMQRLKTRLGIERYFEIKDVKEDKTSSDVVANLLYAKALLPEFKANTKLKQYDKILLKKTSNEVYALTDSILKKLTIIAQYKGINLNIENPPYIYNLSPSHVYQKGIESIEKVMKFKTSEGFYKSNIPSQPFQEVTPDEVYELVDRLDATITLVLQKNYDASIKQYKYSLAKNIFTAKTPSDVYNKLWKISNSLDRLLGTEYTPNETYILAQQIEHSVDNILAYFEIREPATTTTTTKTSVKSPREVFNETLKLYKILNEIKQRANIKAQNIEIPKEKHITPNSVYNALRIITASINSFIITNEIPIEEQALSNIVKNKTPTDVYELVQNSNNKLHRLFEDDKY